MVERASQGDDLALDELVAQWLPEVQRLIAKRAPRQLLLQESRADLAQSVCRDALERIQRGGVEYRGEAPFRAWLLGAVELKLRDRWRRNHTQRRAGGLAPALDVGQEDPARSQTSPSMAAERAETQARLETLLQRLDKRSAAVVREVQLQGRSHAEVAAELGIEVSHSRTLLARALARLATMASED